MQKQATEVAILYAWVNRVPTKFGMQCKSYWTCTWQKSTKSCEKVAEHAESCESCHFPAKWLKVAKKLRASSGKGY